MLPHLPLTTHEAIASAAVKTAWETHAACIIALTETGRMGKAFARFRPIPPVLAITASPTAARQMCILRGIHPLVTMTMKGTQDIIQQALRAALLSNIASPGDPVIITSGAIEGTPDQPTCSKSHIVPVWRTSRPLRVSFVITAVHEIRKVCFIVSHVVAE